MKPSLFLALVLLSAPAAAQLPFVETFTGGSNVGGWTVGVPSTFPASGGNPGAYLRSSILDTFAPQPRTTGPSVFTGNWRALGVQSVGIDLLTLSVNFPFDRELSLILLDDKNTASTADDFSVSFLGTKRVPQVAEGWKSFDFFVDSTSTVMPPGWKVLSPAGGTPDVIWNAVITNVTQVRYFYGAPESFFIFDQWRVGLDNARISDELPATSYCIAKTNSQGCQASVSLSGTPSLTSSTPFLVAATDVVNNKNGILFYGFAPFNAPFQGGTLCVTGIVRRTPAQFSGGNTGTADCSGTYSYDFNARIQSGADPLLLVGEQVFAQYWYRDPQNATGSGLSDAAQFTIQS